MRWQKLRGDEVNHQQEAVYVKQIARLATIVGLGVGIILLAGTAVAGPSGQQAAPKKEKTPGVNDSVVILLDGTALAGPSGQQAAPKKGKTPGVNDFVVVEEMPVLLSATKPVYPEQARKNTIEGEVWIQALIGKDGVVQKAKVQKSSGKGAGLDDAALAAAYKSAYKPAIADGEPVAVWVSYKVVFKLQESISGEKKGK